MCTCANSAFVYARQRAFMYGGEWCLHHPTIQVRARTCSHQSVGACTHTSFVCAHTRFSVCVCVSYHLLMHLVVHISCIRSLVQCFVYISVYIPSPEWVKRGFPNEYMDMCTLSFSSNHDGGLGENRWMNSKTGTSMQSLLNTVVFITDLFDCKVFRASMQIIGKLFSPSKWLMSMHYM